MADGARKDSCKSKNVRSIQLSFSSFEDFWPRLSAVRGRQVRMSLSEIDRDALRLRQRLLGDGQDRGITLQARYEDVPRRDA